MKVLWDSKRNWTIILLVVVIGVMMYAQSITKADKGYLDHVPMVKLDLADIIARDTLRAVTGNNSQSYFVYKGRPMGYEYELLSRFAEHLDVHLEIIIARNTEDFYSLLNSGRADLIANNMTVTQDRQEIVAFTRHYNTVRQVLVQRLPDNWRKYTRDQLDKQLIRNPLDLIDQDVHVRRNSAFDMRLQNLSNEIGGEIDIHYHPGNRSTEELIQMVANGKIDYTISDNNIALMSATYLRNVDIRTDISFPQRIAWAVRKNSPDLLIATNEWIEKMQRSGDFRVIYQKYFKNSKAFSRRLDSDYFSGTGGSISQYDELIRKYALELNWDWRLLAAQVYKESNFDIKAKSWAGARGLMQLIPETAQRFGDSTRMDETEYNLMIGVKYLKWLQDFWKEIPDSAQAVKFVLASYNVGEGHVLDARRLAEKFGKNNTVWDNNVDSFLVKKAYPTYYRDEVSYYGYCRGTEPYNYVKDIMTIYGHYSKLVIDTATGTDSTGTVVKIG